MTFRMHYAARRVAGKRLLGTLAALCGAYPSNAANVIGHESLVTCRRCKRHLAAGRSFHVDGKAVTYDVAWGAALSVTKAALAWPESLNAMPSRVKALKKRVAELEAALAERGEREE